MADDADSAAKAAPPEVDLADQFKKEANDPAMIAYLKSLGIDPDYQPPKDDPRRVVVKEFSILFQDHPTPVVLKFDTEEDIKKASKTPMVIKEGCNYKMEVTFRVQHNVVLGLKIINTVSKMGKTIAKDTEMLGTFPPKNDFSKVQVPKHEWNEAPSGMIARGEYKSKMKFTDDDGANHLEFDYVVKISKDFKD